MSNRKSWVIGAVAAGIVGGCLVAAWAEGGYVTKIYKDLGGDRLVVTSGGVIAVGTGGLLTIADGLARSNLATETKIYSIPLPDLRQAGAAKDALPDSPDGTTLGLGDVQIAKLTGTNTNGGATATASETAFAAFVLPAEYVAGGAVTVRMRAQVTAAREVSATVGFTAKTKAADGTMGSDLVATAAQDLTTSYADYDFTVTATSLSPGDVLYLEPTLATDDTGGSSNGHARATQIQVHCEVKG